MAVTKIKPIRSTIEKSIAYITNPGKTEDCLFVSSEHCFPETAAVEFQFYLDKARAGGNTIGRHLIQSFAPDETTPEQAHEIGKRLAEEILGGQYAYVLATHLDRDHIHNHFVWCAVNIETHKKYVSNKTSYRKIQDASDKLCAEYSLSVITEKSGQRGKSFSEYQADKQGTSWKSLLRKTMDNCIGSANSFEDFISQMQNAGYEVKHGKHISFRAAGQERFTRAKTIGDDYIEERIRERITDMLLSPSPLSQTVVGQKDTGDIIATGSSVSSFKLEVIDIEGNEKIKSSPGYHHWATLHNLKVNSQTLIYLQQHGMADIGEFNRRYESSSAKFARAKKALSITDGRIKTLEALQKEIRNYARTKESYKIYKAAKNKADFLRDNRDIESDVIIHEAAKRHFDKYTGEYGKPLPPMKVVSSELASLKASRKQQYAEYRTAKTEHDAMIKLKVNLQSTLGKDAVRERQYGNEVIL